MGIKYYCKILVLFLLLFPIITCGEIIGFSSFPAPDLGNIKYIYIYITDESLEALYNSAHEDYWANCIYNDDNIKTNALIKIRGFTSKLYPKKSFSLKFVNDNEVIRYALESTGGPWIKNRILMYAYRQVGLPAPNSIGAALFINNLYIGCYARMDIYNEKNLKKNLL